MFCDSRKFCDSRRLLYDYLYSTTIIGNTVWPYAAYSVCSSCTLHTYAVRQCRRAWTVAGRCVRSRAYSRNGRRCEVFICEEDDIEEERMRLEHNLLVGVGMERILRGHGQRRARTGAGACGWQMLHLQDCSASGRYYRVVWSGWVVHKSKTRTRIRTATSRTTSRSMGLACATAARLLRWWPLLSCGVECLGGA